MGEKIVNMPHRRFWSQFEVPRGGSDLDSTAVRLDNELLVETWKNKSFVLYIPFKEVDSPDRLITKMIKERKKHEKCSDSKDPLIIDLEGEGRIDREDREIFATIDRVYGEGIPARKGVPNLLKVAYRYKEVAVNTISKVGSTPVALYFSFIIKFRRDLDLSLINKILTRKGWICSKRIFANFNAYRLSRAHLRGLDWGNLTSSVIEKLNDNGDRLVRVCILDDQAIIQLNLSFPRAMLCKEISRFLRVMEKLHEYTYKIEELIFIDLFRWAVIRTNENVLAVDYYNCCLLTYNTLGEIFLYSLNDLEKCIIQGKNYQGIRISARECLKHLRGEGLKIGSPSFVYFLIAKKPTKTKILKKLMKKNEIFRSPCYDFCENDYMGYPFLE